MRSGSWCSQNLTNRFARTALTTSSFPALFLRVAWKRRFEARARSVGNPVRDLGPILKIAFKSGSSSLHPFRPLLPNISLFYFIDFSRLRCSETVKASQYTERRVSSETRPLLAKSRAWACRWVEHRWLISQWKLSKPNWHGLSGQTRFNPFIPSFKQYILPNFLTEMCERESENIGVITWSGEVLKAKFFMQRL